MVLYREYCFPNCTKLWRMKLLFRFWGGDDRPNRPPLYPPVHGIILEACVLKLQSRYQSATHISHPFHQVTFSGEPLCNSLRWSGKNGFQQPIIGLLSSIWLDQDLTKTGWKCNHAKSSLADLWDAFLSVTDRTRLDIISWDILDTWQKPLQLDKVAWLPGFQYSFLRTFRNSAPQNPERHFEDTRSYTLRYGRRKGGQRSLPSMDFENFSKKCCFFGFEWKKLNPSLAPT